MKLAKFCIHCGCEWTLPKEPAFKEVCRECGEFLHVCANCDFWDPNGRVCRHDQVDESWEQYRANFCEFFKFAERVGDVRPERGSDAAKARDRWNSLFKD